MGASSSQNYNCRNCRNCKKVYSAPIISKKYNDYVKKMSKYYKAKKEHLLQRNLLLCGSCFKSHDKCQKINENDECIYISAYTYTEINKYFPDASYIFCHSCHDKYRNEINKNMNNVNKIIRSDTYDNDEIEIQRTELLKDLEIIGIYFDKAMFESKCSIDCCKCHKQTQFSIRHRDVFDNYVVYVSTMCKDACNPNNKLVTKLSDSIHTMILCEECYNNTTLCCCCYRPSDVSYSLPISELPPKLHCRLIRTKTINMSNGKNNDKTYLCYVCNNDHQLVINKLKADYEQQHKKIISSKQNDLRYDTKKIINHIECKTRQQYGTFN